MIKELELFEVSVVSVPANQNALFSIAKNFESDKEYEEYKKQFIKSNDKETLMVDTNKGKEGNSDTPSPAEIKQQILDEIRAEKEAEEKRQKKAEEEQQRIENTATTAAEKLVKELESRLEAAENQDKDITEILSSLRDETKRNSEELQKLFDSRENKMHFAEEGKDARYGHLTAAEKDGLLYASWVHQKPVHELKSFEKFVTKSGMEHWDSSVVGQWETEYSTRIMEAMRESLVLEPLFTVIPMNTPTMYMPINPEAGDAEWIHENAYRSTQTLESEAGDATDTSTGSAQTHQLEEQVLTARKLATREYIGYEEEEDSIVALAPVINDAIARRMARAADRAYLRGAGVLTNSPSYDPITGLVNRGGSTTDVGVSNTANSANSWRDNFTEDDIVDLRRNLGIYGLDPENLVLLTSHDLYYEIMKLPNFKTVDVLADRATIVTGQVGSLFGIRVVVSQQFDNGNITSDTVGTVLGVLARPQNFVVGQHRGLTTETDRDIINQKRVIVSSRRLAFQDIITGQGSVNLEISS